MANYSAEELARQFKRHQTDFEARVEPHPDHAPQFRLSFPDAATGLGIIDVSAGGVGIRCGVFIPKNLRVTLHLSDVAPENGVPGQLLAIKAIVRRPVLVDHKPTYHIGMQFLDPTGQDEQTLVRAATAAKAKRDSEAGRQQLETVGAGEAKG